MQSFHDFLSFKFSTERLPGLAQIERGHILAWDWNETHELTPDSWKFSTRHQRALKLSFVMGTFFPPPRKRCMRCRKPRSSGIGHMVVNEWLGDTKRLLQNQSLIRSKQVLLS